MQQIVNECFCIPGLTDGWREHHKLIKRAILKYQFGITKGMDFKQLAGHDVFSFRANDQMRILLVKMPAVVDGVQKEVSVILECTLHDHQTARFLRPGTPPILESYLANHTIADWCRVTTDEDSDAWLVSSGEFRERNLFRAMLDAKQKQLCEETATNYGNQRKATLVCGAAGSGKTTAEAALVLDIAQRIHEMQADEEYQVLWAMKSARLAHAVNQAYRSEVINPVANVTLMIKDFDAIFVPHPATITKDEFKNAWKKELDKYCKRNAISSDVKARLRNHEAAWSEFSNILPLLAYNQDLETQHDAILVAYRRINKRVSMYDDAELRTVVFELWFKNFRHNIAFQPPQVREEYKNLQYVIIDEAQDVSVLYMLALAPLPSLCLYASLAGEQGLFGIRATELWKQTLHMIYEGRVNRYDLGSESWRCSEKVIELSNLIQSIRYALTGGTVNDMEKPFHESKSGAPGAASYVNNPENLREYISWITENNVQVAFIVLDEAARQELIAEFSLAVEMIYTPEECKGLEFDNVVVYKPFNKLEFKEVNIRMGHEDFVPVPVGAKVNCRSGAEIDDKLEYAFNALHVAITRAHNSAMIFAPSQRHISDNICQYLQHNVNSWNDWRDKLATVTNSDNLQAKEEAWADIVLEHARRGEFERAADIMEKHITQESIRVKLNEFIAELHQEVGSISVEFPESVEETKSAEELPSQLAIRIAELPVASTISRQARRRNARHKTNLTPAPVAPAPVPVAAPKAAVTAEFSDKFVRMIREEFSRQVKTFADLLSKARVSDYENYTWYELLMLLDEQTPVLRMGRGHLLFSIVFRKDMHNFCIGNVLDPRYVMNEEDYHNVRRYFDYLMPILFEQFEDIRHNPTNLFLLVAHNCRAYKYLSDIYALLDKIQQDAGSDRTICERFFALSIQSLREENRRAALDRNIPTAMQIMSYYVLQRYHASTEDRYSILQEEEVLVILMLFRDMGMFKEAYNMHIVNDDWGWFLRHKKYGQPFFNLLNPITCYCLMPETISFLSEAHITREIILTQIPYNLKKKDTISYLWTISAHARQYETGYEPLMRKLFPESLYGIAAQQMIHAYKLKQTPEDAHLRQQVAQFADFINRYIIHVCMIVNPEDWFSASSTSYGDVFAHAIPWMNLPRSIRENIISHYCSREMADEFVKPNLFEFLIQHDFASLIHLHENSSVVSAITAETWKQVLSHDYIGITIVDMMKHEKCAALLVDCGNLVRVMAEMIVMQRKLYTIDLMACSFNEFNIEKERRGNSFYGPGYDNAVRRVLNMLEVSAVLFHNAVKIGDYYSFDIIRGDAISIDTLEWTITTRIYAKLNADLMATPAQDITCYFEKIDRIIACLQILREISYQRGALEVSRFERMMQEIYTIFAEVCMPFTGPIKNASPEISARLLKSLQDKFLTGVENSPARSEILAWYRNSRLANDHIDTILTASV